MVEKGSGVTEEQILDFDSRLKATAEHLREYVPWTKSHNRRRSRREMRDILDQRVNQLRSVEEAQEALSGDRSNLIFYDNGKGKIIGFTKKD